MKEALTQEQEAIVCAPPESKVLVTAAAGTGKTHVLIERLIRLVNQHRLSPGRELLVLSFSRAAVAVIKQRLSNTQGDVRYVRAQTFDSFATRVLATYDPLGTWSDKDYDERIELALLALSRDKNLKAELLSYAHVVVDEIQDLVGIRACFVRDLILGAANAGFTLFGDPAQAIFDFQLRSDTNQFTSQDFYQWLRRDFKDLREYGLTKNFRAKTEAARAALILDSELRSMRPSYTKIRGKLDNIILNLPTVGPMESLVRMLNKNGTSTAILCRTNGQALVISQDLFKRGVPHRLQQRATDRSLARWVGTVLSGLDAGRIGKSRLEKRISEIADVGVPDFQIVWKLLKSIDRRQSDDVDISLINERIRRREFPDELNQQRESNLVVSTIHRAKGLEFDRVLILGPTDGSREPETPEQFAEETRLLYVALTRPRRDLLHMEAPKTSYLALNQDVDRWVRRGFKSWMTAGIEVRGDDTHSTDPAGGFLIREDAAFIQHYIRTSIQPGAEVVLEKRSIVDQGMSKVYYVIKHGRQFVGITSDMFGASLFRVLKISKKWKVSWPSEIRDLHIDDIDTVAGTEASAKRCGLGGSGIWLRVRLCGLGNLTFEKS